MLRQLQGVLAVSLATQREGLQTLQQQEGPEGVLARPNVPQALHSATDDKGQVRLEGTIRTKDVPELHSMVPRRGLREDRELPVVPRESPGVDDDPSNGRAVAPDPLRRRGHHNVRAMVNGPAQEAAHPEGVVDDQGHPVVVGQLGQPSNVRDIVPWVPHRLNVQGFGVGVDEGREVLQRIRGRKLHLDAQPGQSDLELVESAAVQVGRGDDIVALRAQRGDGQELRSVARRGRQGCQPALQRGHPLLEHIRGGVHDPGVDVAKLLQTEKPRGVLVAVEDVGRGGVDRRGTGLRRGGGGLSGVQLQRLELRGALRLFRLRWFRGSGFTCRLGGVLLDELQWVLGPRLEHLPQQPVDHLRDAVLEQVFRATGHFRFFPFRYFGFEPKEEKEGRKLRGTKK
eukprot:RCo012629